jgi:8-oxo-dGTP diphosphatase
MEFGTMINAVGVWFYSIKTDRYLYLLRNDNKNPGSWGLPGGKVNKDESLNDAIIRECKEEIGFWPETLKLVPIEQFTSVDNHFSYHTFFCTVEQEFTPILNNDEILQKIEVIRNFHISQLDINSE